MQLQRRNFGLHLPQRAAHQQQRRRAITPINGLIGKDLGQTDQRLTAGAREIANGIYSQLASLAARRSEEHTSELQSLMRISYAVFCLKKKRNKERKTSPVS